MAKQTYDYFANQPDARGTYRWKQEPVASVPISTTIELVDANGTILETWKANGHDAFLETTTYTQIP